MKENEYSEAATQVLNILNYTRSEDIKKIPESFIKFLNDISDKSDIPKFNYEQPISGLNLKRQTKELLGFIYITWWCDENDRKKYKDIIRSNVLKNERKENYNINDIFKNKDEKRIDINIKDNENIKNSIVKNEENNLIKRFLNKLFNFFK